jgi:tetratricopeptide (TPR) repeat protein
VTFLTLARLLHRRIVMTVRVFTLLTVCAALFGADEQRLALALRAQTDFERVLLAPAPQLHATNVCVQSQAAMIPVAGPEEAPVFQFRKGYCTLAAAMITGEPNGYRQAAWAFEQASAAWTARNAALAKKRFAEPLPSVIPVLASIAKLKAGQGDVKQIAEAVNARVCNDALTTPQLCESILLAGREWLGWAALQREDIYGAGREFPAASTAWIDWVAGKKAFENRQYADAAAAYRKAVEAWSQPRAAAPIRERLGPPVGLSVAYSEMGGAQLLAGDAKGAIATLNLALKHDAKNARALFLRGRARDAAGQTEAAIADYSLAARNALGLGRGAHLSRDFVLSA